MTLHVYIARRFFWTFSAVMAVFLGVLFLIEMVESVRRFDSDEFGLGDVAVLTILRVPESLYAIMPLVAIIATITLFLTLARTSELVISRASGRSAIRSLVAPLVVSAIIGTLCVIAFNPIVSATSRQYEVLVDRFVSGPGSALSLSPEGLWLRQGDTRGQIVIRALGANLDGTRLSGVSFLALAPDGTPVFRVEAALAQLVPGGWEITDAKQWRFGTTDNPEAQSETHETMSLPSNLTRDQIRDSFGTPSSISFWDLPEFISQLERAGFSALNHRVWYQSQLALPVLLIAMVMLGAGFTMRHTRLGRTGLMILLSLLSGFVLFFVKNFAQILAENGQISVMLGVWGPPLAAICLSLGLLLHLEDG